jgi:hypothetical protein
MNKLNYYFLILLSFIFLSINAQNSPILNKQKFNISDDNITIAPLNFEGIGLDGNGYINTKERFNYNNSISWFCWINTTSRYGYGYIMSEYKNSNNFNLRVQMNYGRLKIMLKLGDESSVIISPNTINDGIDHFIGFNLVINDTIKYITLWIDNKIVSSVILPEDYDNILNINTPFWIGTKNEIQLYTFKGIIDEVLIYNRNLLKTEINYLYGNGTMKTCNHPNDINMDDLIGWYKFSEGFGGSTINEITNNSAFLYNEVYWIDHRDRE